MTKKYDEMSVLKMAEVNGKQAALRFNEEGVLLQRAFVGYLSHDTLFTLHKNLRQEILKRRTDRAKGKNNYPY